MPHKALAKAADIIQQGGVVAFPTETFYGLAVDPMNPAALKRLF
ncbi:MAG: Sua5/YciO/YrdC/YwlC family protein, partial [Desulfobulbaceae bacterium]|nr:Sua5/YciO/YrdC/YwlC family protein [Desulfobulbaceae bacterium]